MAYILKVGGAGAEVSQFVLYPQRTEVEMALQGTGSLSWMKQTIAQNPSQCHIINSLASLPIKKVTNAMMTEGQTFLHSAGASVIE